MAATNRRVEGNRRMVTQTDKHAAPVTSFGFDGRADRQPGPAKAPQTGGPMPVGCSRLDQPHPSSKIARTPSIVTNSASGD